MPQIKINKTINPALGKYKTLSATTKPTGKNRLEAGINGNISKANPKFIAIDQGAWIWILK